MANNIIQKFRTETFQTPQTTIRQYLIFTATHKCIVWVISSSPYIAKTPYILEAGGKIYTNYTLTFGNYNAGGTHLIFELE